MRNESRAAFTLIELLVVLAIMGLASAIVLPALLHTHPNDGALQSVIDRARDAAAHRGELIYLRIDPTGTWHMTGGGSTLQGDSTTGRVTPLAAMPVTILVAPSGSCAFDVRSAAAARTIALDPLTCTLAAVVTPSPGS